MLIFVLIVVIVSTSYEEKDLLEKVVSVRKNFGWGRNLNGILGVGDTIAHQDPVQVGVGTEFSDIATPFRRIWACAQRSFLQSGDEYNIYGFGSDHSCGLGCGDNSLNTFSKPMLIDGISDVDDYVTSMRCISDHTLALTKNGNLWGFGSNDYYALGLKEIEVSTSKCETIEYPGYICEPFKLREEGDVIEISTGDCHSLFLRNDGVPYGTGCNLQYELGIHTNKTLSEFVPIPFSTSPTIVHISSGPHYSVFVSDMGDLYFTGKIVCETFSAFVSANHTTLLFDHLEIGARIVNVSAGFTHFVGKFDNGSYWVFGCNDYHVIDQNDPHVPQYESFRIYDISMILSDGTDEIERMLAGDCSTAVLTMNGNIWYLGKSGNNDDENQKTMKVFPDFERLKEPTSPEKIVDIDISSDHFLAISDAGTLYCMGENNVFQCGIIPRFPFTDFRSFQSNVFTIDNVFELKISNGHSFGITAYDGQVYSFGDNSYGQLGTGPFIDYYLPYPVFDQKELEEYFRKYLIGGDVSFENSAFLMDTGEIYVTGNGEYGCLGLGDTQTRYTPEKIDLSNFNDKHVVSVGLGMNHVHALTSDKKMYSWGLGIYGQLGLGHEILHAYVPVLNELILGDVESFNVGDQFVMVILTNNVILQWGSISTKSVLTDLAYKPTPVNCEEMMGEDVDLEKDDFVEFCGGRVNLIIAGASFAMVDVDYPNENTYQIYYWGSLGYRPYTEKPTLLYTHEDRFVQCEARNHIICINEHGEAYGMGDNVFNQANPTKTGEDYISHFEKIELDSFPNIEVTKFSRSSVSDYSTVLQEYVSCFGKMDSDYGVCNSHGKCVMNDTCRCFDGYGGTGCNSNACVSKSLNITINCDGHGDCYEPNTCHCEQGWTSSPPSEDYEDGFCNYFDCPKGEKGRVCSGNGECELLSGEESPKCVCDGDKARGLDCSLPICNGYNGSSTTYDGCGFQSECTAYDHCSCKLSGLNYLLPLQQGHGDKGCILSWSTLVVYIVIISVISVCLCCVIGSCIFLGFCSCETLLGVCCCCLCFEKLQSHRIKQKDVEEKRNEIFIDYKSPYHYKQEYFDDLIKNEKEQNKAKEEEEEEEEDEGEEEEEEEEEINIKVEEEENEGEEEEEEVLESLKPAMKHINAMRLSKTITQPKKKKKKKSKKKTKTTEESTSPSYDSSSFTESFEGNQNVEKIRITESTGLLGISLGSIDADEKVYYYDDPDNNNNHETPHHRQRVNHLERIRLGKHHIFFGDPYHGIGTIFYKEEVKGILYHSMKLFPVFRGRFRNGKRHGYGIEFRPHPVSYPVPDGFYTTSKYVKFRGQFRDDLRHGKGTEYDEYDGEESLVGMYKNNVLIRILSIDYPLRIIDLKNDIEYAKPKAKVIGVGGFSRIISGRMNFKKKDMKDRNRRKVEVAVKIFKDRIWKKDDLPQMMQEIKRKGFLQDVSDTLKILSMFEHPNIVRILGWSGVSGRRYGYVMEKCRCSVQQYYFDRDSLEKKLSMGEKNLLLFQVVEGMRHVHTVMKLVHRDLKWENVLLDEWNQVKLCDFDLADRDEMDFTKKKDIQKLRGSYFHIAPEIMIRNTVDYKCDVYSFGIMMFELLWNRKGDPLDLFSSSRCSVCSEEFVMPEDENPKSFVISFLRDHYSRCELKPRLLGYTEIPEFGQISEEISDDRVHLLSAEHHPKSMKEEVRVYRWQVQLLERCFDHVPENRPSFEEIAQIFRLNRKKSKIELLNKYNEGRSTKSFDESSSRNFERFSIQ